MDQLTLFAPEPAPAPEARTGFCGMPESVRRRWKRANEEDVAAEVIAIAAAHRGQWLDRAPFRALIEKHQISFCFGHVLARLARSGRLEVQEIYLGQGVGAERPGSPNFQGSYCLYRAASAEAA